mmetsp:Transcript_78202/g.135613  ORF Transcript_78202/g.135613 Transcript_78202/m.135613 type:complete len:568 (-) Transcript_78202:62-1765(-)
MTAHLCHMLRLALAILLAVVPGASQEESGCLSWDAGFCAAALDEPVVQLQVNSQVVKRRGKKQKSQLEPKTQLEPQDADSNAAAPPRADAAEKGRAPELGGDASKETAAASKAPKVPLEATAHAALSIEPASAPLVESLKKDDPAAEVAHSEDPYSLLQVESNSEATMVRRADAADGASMAFEALAGIMLGVLGHGDGVTKLSFKHRWFGHLTAFLLVTFMCLLLVVLTKAFIQHRTKSEMLTPVVKRGTSGTHRYVSAIPRTSALEVERLLPRAVGDDAYPSTVLRPMTSQQLVRLEARVEGPLTGNALVSPLVQRDCVCYSAAVWKQGQDCTRPVSFKTAGVDFDVVLLDAPHVRIDVRGEDVSLFAMQLGPRMERCAMESAPDHWKDFVVSHQMLAPEHTGTTSTLVGSDLEFQESLLVLGATVILVGELCRSASGRLSLRPWNGDDEETAEAVQVHDAWRTSWELLGCPNKAIEAKGKTSALESPKASPGTEHASSYPSDDEPSTTLLSEADRGKVLISDDPSLFSGVARAAASAAAAAAAATAKQSREPMTRPFLSRLLMMN